MLVKWGIERALKEQLPAYLESTDEAGHLYESLGFKPAASITMVLDGVGKDGTSVNYEEISYIFTNEVKS